MERDRKRGQKVSETMLFSAGQNYQKQQKKPFVVRINFQPALKDITLFEQFWSKI